MYNVQHVEGKHMTKKRRSYSAEFKFKVALEAAKGLKTLNELSSEHGVHPNQISQWKGELLQGGATIFSNRSARQQRVRLSPFVGPQIGPKMSLFRTCLFRRPVVQCRRVRRTMFDRIRFRRPIITRQFSAAKGLMGACPHMRLFHPH